MILAAGAECSVGMRKAVDLEICNDLLKPLNDPRIDWALSKAVRLGSVTGQCDGAWGSVMGPGAV